MGKHKIAKVVIAVLTAFLLIPSAYTGVYAEEKTGSSRIEAINNVSTGVVTIKLEEFELINGKEQPYTDNKIVVPGQDISKIARITNTGYKAWIRASLKVVSEDGIKDLSEDICTISDTEHWKKIGNYWYYTIPLDHNEKTDFLKAVHIPEEWTEEYSGKRFQVIVNVDAVQWKNFTPKFDSKEPWFGTVIETSIHEKADITPSHEDTFLVEYRGGAEGLIKKGDDFFYNWPALMPGDTYSDQLVVQNSYASPVNIYFSTEKLDDSDLAKAVTLKIWRGEELIYDGNLQGTVPEMLLVQNLKKDEIMVLRYEVSIPASLQNAYALKYSKTKWIFRCELLNPGVVSDNPRTADLFDPEKLLMITGTALLVAAGAVIIILLRKKEEQA